MYALQQWDICFQMYQSQSVDSALAEAVAGHKPLTQVLSTLIQYTVPPAHVLTTVFVGLRVGTMCMLSLFQQIDLTDRSDFEWMSCF